MNPARAYDVEFDETGTDGWAYGYPAGIREVQWPRTRGNGVPMAHLFTLRIPEEYRRDPKHVAFSVFQGSDGDGGGGETDGVAELINGETTLNELDIDDALRSTWEGIAKYAENRHPAEFYVEDIIGCGWCMIFLTEEEFNGKECTPPPFNPAFCDMDELGGMPQFNRDDERRNIRLAERKGDPNVGLNPEEFPEWIDDLDEKEIEAMDSVSSVEIKGYIPPYSALGRKLGLPDRFFGLQHFGGTMFPAQGTPRNMGPCYFEFDEALGEANLGGDGAAQINLTEPDIDWACG